MLISASFSLAKAKLTPPTANKNARKAKVLFHLRLSKLSRISSTVPVAI